MPLSKAQPPAALPRTRLIQSKPSVTVTGVLGAACYGLAARASSVMAWSESTVTCGLTTSAPSTPKPVPGCGLNMLNWML